MKNNKPLLKGNLLIILEVTLFAFLFSLIQSGANAGIGTPNATTLTNVTIGNVYPEILNVSINDGSPVTLIGNSTKIVNCVAVIRDFNGETDLNTTNATFFDSSFLLSDPDDNNNHYTNTSCNISNSFGSYNGYNDDVYTALANCSFTLEYYSNVGEWTCSVFLNDSTGWEDQSSNVENISELLSIGLDDILEYGEVTTSEVSLENTTNVTNFGNVDINISLEGYARIPNDGYAMNCTQGFLENISIEHEKYNLTNSNPGVLTLSQANANYTNLSTTAVVKYFNLTQRQNDSVNDRIKTTYWRIYVPIGVAGSCQGNIIFGATTAPGT